MIDTTKQIICHNCGNKYAYGVKYCMGCGVVMDDNYKPVPYLANDLIFPNKDLIRSFNINKDHGRNEVFNLSSITPEYIPSIQKTTVELTFLSKYFDRIMKKLPNGMYSVILPFRDGLIYNFKGHLDNEDFPVVNNEILISSVFLSVYEETAIMNDLIAKSEEYEKKALDLCGICGSEMPLGKCEVCLDV